MTMPCDKRRFRGLTPLGRGHIACLCCILRRRLDGCYGTLTEAYSLVMPALTRLYRSVPYSVQALDKGV